MMNWVVGIWLPWFIDSESLSGNQMMLYEAMKHTEKKLLFPDKEDVSMLPSLDETKI